MAFIIFFFFFFKKLKKVKKLELSPQNFRYDVLYPLYSGFTLINFLPCIGTFVHVGRNLQVGSHSPRYPKDSFDLQLFSEHFHNQVKQSYTKFFSNDMSF